MSGRHGTLEYNLALLQDCIRRDPESYKDEFLEQYRHFEHTLQLFRLQPSLDPTRLLELIGFHSHVAHCYPNDTKTLSNDLMDLLRHNADNLHPELRLGAAKAIALLRNRNLAPPLACFHLFFDLSKCRDKELRKFLFSSTVQYVKLLNSKSKDVKVNSELQRFVLSRLQTANSSKVVARMALLLLIDLYRRRIWMDAKTVNAIALGGCLSNVMKLSATACKFFLGKELEDDDGEISNDEEDGNQGATTRTLKEVMVGFRAGRKTNKRKRNLERARQTLQKLEKKRNKAGGDKNAGTTALRLLYDPQEFAEQLFRKLEHKSKNERFEFRMLIMALLARVIGLHKVQILNFYSFILRYLQPKQQEVTKILLFAAQASHDLVPPDSVEMMVKTIVDNFVTDRNSPEAITVGLNACREILSNCPLATNEDLLRDLVEYKKYRNKNVSMAARSLIQLFRDVNPDLLHKRDRGRPTEANKEFIPTKLYGESRVVVGALPGAECLVKAVDDEKATTPNESDIDNEESGDDISFSDEIEEEGSDNDADNKEMENGNNASATPDAPDIAKAAAELSTSHIFSQDDFRRIRKHQLKKHLQPYRKRRLEQEAMKNQKKRKMENESTLKEDEISDAELDDSNDEDEEGEKGELPRLADIEHLHKRPKMDRQARMESVQAGREGREKFGRPKPKGPHVGRTNKTLAKRKAFVMVRRKEAKKMKRRSFREKQLALRNYLIKQKKNA